MTYIQLVVLLVMVGNTLIVIWCITSLCLCKLWKQAGTNVKLEFGLVRDKRREKVQESCNYGNGAHTKWTCAWAWCVACSFAPDMVHMYASVGILWFWFYAISRATFSHVLDWPKYSKRNVKKSVSEMIWHQSDLTWHQWMMITKSYQQGYLWGDRCYIYNAESISFLQWGK